jgi:hypothetical protein
MANDDDDDDFLDGPIPADDAEPSASERAHARAFADLVDKTLAGRTPPAMSADDRALLEVATVIRAASGRVELPVAQRQAVVEDALRQAIGGAAAKSLGATPIASIAARRRWLPWTVAAVSTAVAAAAVVALWLGVGGPGGAGPDDVAPRTAARGVPLEQRSRPSDALVGPIARDRAGDAEGRIDAIFADRLDGYRAELYGGGQ